MIVGIYFKILKNKNGKEERNVIDKNKNDKMMISEVK